MEFYLSAIFLVYFLSGITTLVEAIKGKNVTLVEEGQHSYVVSIAYKNVHLRQEEEHFCTGVLFERNLVLTAAHCLKGQSPNETEVVAGSVDLREGEKYNISMWITYEEWADSKGMTFVKDVNDIAVIKLATNVIRRVATPATLSFEPGYFLYDDYFDLLGWGYSNESPENASRYLRKARTKVLSDQLCENIWHNLYKEKRRFPREFFCSKGAPNGFIACGDSGGPVARMNGAVVGLHRSTCPTAGLSNAQVNFINDHKMNIHSNLDLSKPFLDDIFNNYSKL